MPKMNISKKELESIVYNNLRHTAVKDKRFDCYTHIYYIGAEEPDEQDYSLYKSSSFDHSSDKISQKSTKFYYHRAVVIISSVLKYSLEDTPWDILMHDGEPYYEELLFLMCKSM